MKLNYKRTFLVGFAFLSISAFWQMYDTIIPLIMRDTYHLGDGPAGIIMSLDNIVALFLLPLFGALSDKVGRRIPNLELPWSSIHTLITDDRLDSQVAEQIRARGVQLILAAAS